MFKISVWKNAGGQVWTLDLRRLGAFRLSDLKRAPIQWVDPSGEMWKVSTKNGGTSIKLKLGDGNNIIIK